MYRYRLVQALLPFYHNFNFIRVSFGFLCKAVYYSYLVPIRLLFCHSSLALSQQCFSCFSSNILLNTI